MATIQVQRRDAIPLTSKRKTAEGYLVAPGRVAKVGILTYYDGEGKPFKEFVPETTLFDAESTKGLIGLPVTNKHPKDKVDATNATDVARGFTFGEARREKDGEDDLLGCDIKVLAKELVDSVDSGRQELSLGYDATLDMTPGIYKGEKYDAVQTKRAYNHLAVVDSARAGSKARLRLDSSQNQIVEDEMEMVIIKIDGKDVSVPKESAAAIEAGLKAAAKVDESAVAAEKRRADELQGQLDVLKKKDEEKNSEQTKKDEAAKLNALVKSRAALMTTATSILPKDDHKKLDEMNELEIMKAVLVKLDSTVKFDGLSEDYIKGSFAAATKSSTKADNKDGLGELIVHGTKDKSETKEDGTKVVSMDEFGQMRKQKLKDAWKSPLNKAA